MPWISEWLGEPYCVLKTRYGGNEFTFEEAKKDLAIRAANLLKILSELARSGFLYSKIEKKSRRYMLADFDSIAEGVKARKDSESLDTLDRMRKSAQLGRKYLIIGSIAAFLYHGYQFPIKYEVEVLPKDYGFWKQLVPEVNIKPNLTDAKFKDRKVLDGLYVAPPERVVTEGIARGGVSYILDSASVMVSENGLKNMNWKELDRSCLRLQVVKEAGAILEALSTELTKEYGRSPIPKYILEKLHSRVRDRGRVKQYPREILQKDESYSEIGKAWRLRLYLPKDVIRKPVEDIAPFTLKVV